MTNAKEAWEVTLPGGAKLLVWFDPDVSESDVRDGLESYAKGMETLPVRKVTT